jgi:hypothetical protein
MKTNLFAFPVLFGPGLVSALARGALAVLAAGSLGGCMGSVGEPPAGEALGQVSVSLAVVPADIQCLRVTGDGPDRSVVRDVDIAATMGMTGPITATLTGIPLGPVTFSAQAFADACPGVTKSTIADWVSDPTTVSVSLGHLASIDLTMHRNGRAKVTIDFPDEAVCSPEGAACVSATTCCSHSCSKGLCKASADADGGAGTGADGV